MNLTDLPARISLPFASSAGAAYINPVPVPSQIGITPGRASYTDGFPPLNFIAESAGGIPPSGKDFNGLLNQITAWSRWQAVGSPVPYDSSFAASIGGYPRGARVISTSGAITFVSTSDANSSDPNSIGATNWRAESSTWSAQSWVTTGSANAQVLTLAPAPANTTQLVGIPIPITSVGTNTGAVTLNVNSFGAQPIRTSGGTNLPAGALVTGQVYIVAWTGSFWQLQSHVPVFADPNTAGGAAVGLYGTGSNGANLLLSGNGATTPKKWIRAVNGRLSILNDAATAEILGLSDSGAVSFGGSVTAAGGGSFGDDVNVAGDINSTAGNIYASAGRVRSAFGAYGTGDNSVATILGDFTYINQGANRFSYRLPDGTLFQWGFAQGPAIANGSSGNINFGLPFNGGLQSLTLTPANNSGVSTQSWILATFNDHFTFSCNAGNISTYWWAVGRA